MKLTELISVMENLIREHGDLEVVAYDGMDPSDLCPVAGMELEVDRTNGSRKARVWTS